MKTKKFALLVLALAFSLGTVKAQTNLVTNGDFETDPTTYTATNELKRVSTIYGTATQITNPTLSSSDTPAAGQWVKMSPGSELTNATILNTGAHTGTYCLDLKIATALTTTTDYSKWWNLAIVQKLTTLSNSKKYIVTFWAKQDASLSNKATSINVFLGDNTLKPQTVTTTTSLFNHFVNLTGGTTWTKYSVYMDVPAYIYTYAATADFSTAAYLGFGIATTWASNATTGNAGILIDDISMTEYSGTPSVRYVKTTGTAGGDGLSWATASNNIIAMVSDIAIGEVRVAAGTYKPASPIQIKDGVNMTGGYPASPVTGTNETRDLVNNQTILDGQNGRKLITAADANPFSRATFDGFIFQNGNASYGTAAYLSHGCVVQNCIFRNNTAGATYDASSAICIKKSAFSGIASSKMGAAIINCVIVNNTSTKNGGGAIYIDNDAASSVINCTIANNKSAATTSVASSTGGIYVGNGTAPTSRITNNIFYNNSYVSAPSYGTANISVVAATGYPLTACYNNWFDEASAPASTVINTASANNKYQGDILRTTIFASPNSISGYSNVAGDITTINNSNWSLASASGCRDAGISTTNADMPFPFSAYSGSNKLYNTITTDIIGNTRVIGTNPDLGAYEFNPVVVTVTAGSNGTATGTITVTKGTSVTVTATPNAGYALNAWTVTAGSAPTPPTTNTWTFTPTVDCTVSASFKSITAFTPVLTYARTATTLDLLVTNPVGYTGTLTYTVMDGSNNVLVSGVAASALTSSKIYSLTGLSANTSQTFKVVAVINGTINSQTTTITASTRKLKNSSIELIDDFEVTNTEWYNINYATITSSTSNTVNGGINPSSNCAKIALASNSAGYAGMANAKERIDVGPAAPYRYLHVKMYRDAAANTGTLGLTLLGRNDISQAQLGTAIAYSSQMIDGSWHDYTFDLQAISASNLTYYGFYFAPNSTGSQAINAYIDDVYLSNDATLATGNVSAIITATAGAGGTVSGGNDYLIGDNVSISATPNAGSAFVNWTEDGTTGLTTNPYLFTASTKKTLVANFASFLLSTTSLTVANPVYGSSSAEQSFTISGSSLTGDITLTPPANYEISTGTGGSFVAQNPITLTQSSGSVGTTTIYVRLIAGSAVGTYNNQNIVVASNGFTNLNVVCAGSVTAAPLTITATGPSKTYGTALTAGTSTTNFTAGATGVGSEAVSSVTLTPNTAGSTTTTAAGAGYVVTPSLAIGTGGFLASNYNITYTAYNGTVAQQALTVTGVTDTKTYDGTTSSSATPTVGTLVTGDAVTASTQTYDNKNYGTTHVLTPAGLTIKNGSNADMTANYNITYTPSPATGVINKVALSIGAASIAPKPYDGTATSGTVTAGSLSGFVYPETVTVSSATGTYADANVGSGKTATIVYTLADGTDGKGGLAANYSLANGSATGAITSIASSWSGTGSWSTTANWTGSVAPNPGTDVTVPNGTTLTVDAGSPVVNSISIEAGAKLNVSNSFSAGTVTLKAVKDATSFSTQLDAAITATNVRLFKTIDDKKWYFMAFPCDVTVAGITKSDGTSLGTLGTDWFIKYYDGAQRGASGNTSGSNWKSISVAADPTKLKANQGYIIALNTGTPDTEILFPLNPGILAAETAPKNIGVLANTGAAAATNFGWNLIGQPYLSNYVTSNATGADSYYIYVSDGIGTYSGYPSATAPTMNPMSAYFVQASSLLVNGYDGTHTYNPAIPAGITFATAGRQLVRSTVFQTELSDQLQLNLSTATGTDNTNLIMDNSQTPDYQIGQDLEKWIGTGTDKPQIYTQLGGINYAYNALPMDYVNNLPVGFYSQTAGATIIHANASKAPSVSALLLTDNTTGITTDLLTSDYSFTTAAGTDNTRFVLSAKRVATANSLLGSAKDEPSISAKDGKLLLGNLNGATNVRVYDAIGRMIVDKVANTNLFEIPINVGGVYTIQLDAGTRNWVKKYVLN